MNNKVITAILVVVLVGTVGWMFSQRSLPQSVSTQARADAPEIALYKSPYCGCCGGWGIHMEQNGFNVTTHEREDMEAVKAEFGVPYDLGSCHTAVIDGYVVEGHVPHEAVEKLLAERPDIKGIGMAGMPSGSPGMPGPKADFMIYEILHDGTVGELYMQL